MKDFFGKYLAINSDKFCIQSMTLKTTSSTNTSFDLKRKLKERPTHISAARDASSSTTTAELFYRTNSSDGSQITVYCSHNSDTTWKLIIYGFVS